MIQKKNIKSIIALLCWSAIFVYGCKSSSKEIDVSEVKPVMKSDNLEITHYSDGKMSYRFITPVLVQYESPDTSYMIFEKGIHITTYDSIGGIKTWLTSKYAIYREKIDEWETRDSVVACDINGKTLYTDLLFWRQKEKRIFSNIKTVVVDGEEMVTGLDGFESDDGLENVEFFNSRGRILVDTVATTTSVDSVVVSTSIDSSK